MSALVTAEVFATLLEIDYKLELVRGELRRLPFSNGERGYLTSQCIQSLLLFEDVKAHGAVLIGTCYLLERHPDTVLAPPLTVFPADRFAVLRHRDWFLEEPPLLAIDIVSPPERKAEIMERAAWFSEFGTPLIWVAFAEERTVLIDSAGRERVVLTEDDVLDGSEVLPGLPSIPVAEIFR
jgi:Uma2 family endonuclease